MGHDVIVCEDCGSYIMEGHNDWHCDECGWGIDSYGKRYHTKTNISPYIKREIERIKLRKSALNKLTKAEDERRKLRESALDKLTSAEIEALNLS